MNRGSIARLLLAALAALMFSGLYYGLVVGAVWRELSGVEGSSSWWEPLAQLARNLVVASVLALTFKKTAINRTRPALGLSIMLWVGFQAMAIAGSVIHEHYPLALYAIHVVDQLGTMIIMAFCLTFGRREGRPITSQLEH